MSIQPPALGPRPVTTGMRLVIDANVLISALARDSAVRAALRVAEDEIHAPSYVLVELRAHRPEIRQKSGLSPSSYDGLLDDLLERIYVVRREDLVSRLPAAARAMRAIDPNDTPYVAAALVVDGTVVSNDRAFERQRAVPHMWTSEFVERTLGPGADDDEHQ